MTMGWPHFQTPKSLLAQPAPEVAAAGCTCPTCGRPHPGAVPVTALLHASMSVMQRTMLEELVKAWPRPVNNAAMVNVLWGLDPSGGPDEPGKVINVMAYDLRAVLAPFGWTVTAERGAGFGARRLVPITEGAWP